MQFSSKMMNSSSSYPSKRQNLTYNFSMASSGRVGAPKAKSTLLDMHTKAELVRTRGGLLDIPRKLKLMTTGNCNYDEHKRRLTKLLLNVNIQNSLGPVQVVMLPENTVEDLIKAVIDVYVKEKRRPLLASTDSTCFHLHYSQFSLQSLKRDEKLINLGSRNFFLWLKPTSNAAQPAKSFCCDDEVKGADQLSVFSFTNLMEFVL